MIEEFGYFWGIVAWAMVVCTVLGAIALVTVAWVLVVCTVLGAIA